MTFDNLFLKVYWARFTFHYLIKFKKWITFEIEVFIEFCYNFMTFDHLLLRVHIREIMQHDGK
jgi:hypothetical protein